MARMPRPEGRLHERHRARPSLRQHRPFFGCVVDDERGLCNPAAHGDRVCIETCSCGAVRETNTNGLHVERGRWHFAEEPDDV